jgi:hypothetical protein
MPRDYTVRPAQLIQRPRLVKILQVVARVNRVIYSSFAFGLNKLLSLYLSLSLPLSLSLDERHWFASTAKSCAALTNLQTVSSESIITWPVLVSRMWGQFRDRSRSRRGVDARQRGIVEGTTTRRIENRTWGSLVKTGTRIVKYVASAVLAFGQELVVQHVDRRLRLHDIAIPI